MRYRTSVSRAVSKRCVWRAYGDGARRHVVVLEFGRAFCLSGGLLVFGLGKAAVRLEMIGRT